MLTTMVRWTIEESFARWPRQWMLRPFCCLINSIIDQSIQFYLWSFDCTHDIRLMHIESRKRSWFMYKFTVLRYWNISWVFFYWGQALWKLWFTRWSHFIYYSFTYFCDKLSCDLFNKRHWLIKLLQKNIRNTLHSTCYINLINAWYDTGWVLK